MDTKIRNAVVDSTKKSAAAYATLPHNDYFQKVDIVVGCNSDEYRMFIQNFDFENSDDMELLSDVILTRHTFQNFTLKGRIDAKDMGVFQEFINMGSKMMQEPNWNEHLYWYCTYVLIFHFMEANKEGKVNLYKIFEDSIFTSIETKKHDDYFSFIFQCNPKYIDVFHSKLKNAPDCKCINAEAGVYSLDLSAFWCN